MDFLMDFLIIQAFSGIFPCFHGSLPQFSHDFGVFHADRPRPFAFVRFVEDDDATEAHCRDRPGDTEF